MISFYIDLAMKTLYFIAIFLSIGSFASTTLEKSKLRAINEITAPFLKVLEHFANGDWAPSPSQDQFKSDAAHMWRILEARKSHWIRLLDHEKNLDEIQKERSKLRKKSYVGKVYTTKVATLVFTLKRFPNILVKMDNRTEEQIGPDRSYYAAWEKSQAVKNSPNKFPALYLPLEEAKKLEYLNISTIFSERIPLFSEEEIDNRILLHMLIKAASESPAIKLQLKNMYEQMIRYICQVNFDDIGYTNVPFSNDGRLAPFDTDSQTAETGVHTFLALFFGYKILTLDEVMATVNDSCKEPVQPNPAQLAALYDNHATEDGFFENNEKFIEEALNFLAKQQASFRSQFNMATIIHDRPSKNYVTMIDEVFAEKLTKNATTFGRHCGHITDLSYAAADKIVAAYPRIKLSTALNIVRDIFIRVKDFGNLYSAEEIQPNLGNKRDLRSFICF
jgi:hypothetical protein